jgi:hypothetical protein
MPGRADDTSGSDDDSDGSPSVRGQGPMRGRGRGRGRGGGRSRRERGAACAPGGATGRADGADGADRLPAPADAGEATAVQKSKKPRSIAFAKMPPSYRGTRGDEAHNDVALKMHWFGLGREQQQQILDDCANELPIPWGKCPAKWKTQWYAAHKDQSGDKDEDTQQCKVDWEAIDAVEQNRLKRELGQQRGASAGPVSGLVVAPPQVYLDEDDTHDVVSWAALVSTHELGASQFDWLAKQRVADADGSQRTQHLTLPKNYDPSAAANAQTPWGRRKPLAHTTLKDSEEWQDREDEFRLLEKEEQQRLVQEYEDKMQGDRGSPQTLQDAFRASGKCNKDRELNKATLQLYDSKRAIHETSLPVLARAQVRIMAACGAGAKRKIKQSKERVRWLRTAKDQRDSKRHGERK